MTDDKITTGNNWRLDQVTAKGIADRMQSGYTAELMGQTQVGTTAVKVLKVKATGTNSLDSVIDYEQIGIDSDDMLRYWAVYATADAKAPNNVLFQMSLDPVTLGVDVPDSTFNI